MATSKAEEASSSTPTCSDAVFLSFAKDTGNTFTSHLYEGLIGAGLHTSRYDKDMQLGENIKSELEKAIQKSRISVVVFSKGYASSKRCLDELVMILEHRKKSRHVILPVFYDVEPTEVRKQTGGFAEEFARHEECCEGDIDQSERINEARKWKAALTEVADLAGMVLQNQQESKFIQKIVKVIEGKLICRPLSISPYLVGMDSRAKNVNLWLRDTSTNNPILVIHGMGGIGKTTIAKFVYNLHYRNFDCRSFLGNIREDSKEANGVIRLQEQLLSDIQNGRPEKLYSVDEGIRKIKNALSYKRVLLVLDDVDQVDIIDAVLDMQNLSALGSKIIITTRLKNLLKSRKVDGCRVELVDKLSHGESSKLFNWHAFGQKHPKEGYTEHAQRFLCHCGGLPLALIVLGSSLFEKSVDVWESKLQKLEAIADNKVLETLRISYESLQDDHDKSLFLDIVCFFVGEDKDRAVSILDGCSFYATIGIENLKDRCLLTIDENKKLQMHQLLQDMGRQIVREESPKYPEERTRLWHHDDSFNVLREKRGTKTVEGLILDMTMLKKDKSMKMSFGVSDKRKGRFEELVESPLLPDNRKSLKQRHFGLLSRWLAKTPSMNSYGVDLETDAFARMFNLRILKFSDVQFNGCYEVFPHKLRWLYWRGFPLKYIPSDFPLESLVALDVCYSNIKQVWKGSKFLGLLKILNLSHSLNLAITPEFSDIPNLERLILKDCPSLIEVRKSIENLEKLILLDLEDCKNLRKLPTNSAVEQLNISGCVNLGRLQEVLSKLKSLKVFHAERINIHVHHLLPVYSEEVKPWHLSILPRQPRKAPQISWAWLPSTLVHLNIGYCNLSDDAFPKDLSNLSMLEYLNLAGNQMHEVPCFIKDLVRLRTLYLLDCNRLQQIRLRRNNITKMFVSGCESLQKITYHDFDLNPGVEYGFTGKLLYSQHHYKREALGMLDAKVMALAGFSDLDSIPNADLTTVVCNIKHGIYSTFIPGEEVPGWFSNKSVGSKIALTVPVLPNSRIRGLNLCCVFTLQDYVGWIDIQVLFVEIRNKSKHLKGNYSLSRIDFPWKKEDLVWLSHWNLGSLLEGGNRLEVSFEVDDPHGHVKECGVQFVYYNQEEEGIIQCPNTQDYGHWINWYLTKYKEGVVQCHGTQFYPSELPDLNLSTVRICTLFTGDNMEDNDEEDENKVN